MPLKRVQTVVGQFPDLKVILFDSSTHTSELAAQALGVTPGQIAKTLVFIAEGQPLLTITCGDTRVTQQLKKYPLIVVTCGDKKLDAKKLARALNVKKIKFADPQTVVDATGFPPGGVSPIGLLNDIPIYLDKSLWDYDLVYAAAGTANSALPIGPDRLLEVTDATVVDVCY